MAKKIWVQSFGEIFPSYGKQLSIKKFHFSKTVATRRAASFKMALHFQPLTDFNTMLLVGEAHATPRGLRAPAAPAPPFFGSPKKGGKESSPLAMSQGFCLRRATPALRLCPRTDVVGAARTGHAQKPSNPQAPARGKKRRAGLPTKTHHPQNWKCVIEKFFTYAFYSDATSFKMTLHF